PLHNLATPHSPPYSFSRLRRPPPSPLFPYTTLFRSHRVDQPRVRHDRAHAAALQLPDEVPREQPAVGLVLALELLRAVLADDAQDRKSTRLNSSHLGISYAVFCLKKKKKKYYTLNKS